MIRKILRQKLKQFGVSCRIGRTEVIDRFHKTTAHQRFPKPIDDRFGKERVLW